MNADQKCLRIFLILIEEYSWSSLIGLFYLFIYIRCLLTQRDDNLIRKYVSKEFAFVLILVD